MHLEPLRQRLVDNGMFASMGAFFIWGLMPVFWKALASVDPVEVLFQRMLWSWITVTLILLVMGGLGPALRIFACGRSLGTLACSGLLLSVNWYLYIWAIGNDMVLETSLGYYITPLINALLGTVLLRERVSRIACLAILLALAGVGLQLFTLGRLPWVALGLSVTFALYTLLRKVVLVEALPGLFVESALQSAVAVVYLAWLVFAGKTVFFRGDVQIDLLMAGAGVATTIPLFLFAYGARRLSMVTVGLMQYISPSMVFLLGVLVYREPLSREGLLTFSCIWGAIGLYVFGALRERRALTRV